ncbi:MAG TPA: PAS domain-containing protein, partial [Burkholderiaceae bacterium]|nr:PAS domain-containing protein [Burkholderiaceae bacterium]
MSDKQLHITSLGSTPWEPPAALIEPAVSTVMLDRMPAYVVILDRDMRYTFANQEFLKYVGRSAEEVIGKTAFEVLGGTAPADYAGIPERMLAGEAFQIDGWHDYPHGPMYLQETLLPFARAGEPVQAVCAFSGDLTALKLREAELAQKVEALEASEALKSAIFDHAFLGLVSTRPDGCLVEFNPAAAAMFGRARAAVLGHPIDTLIAARDRAAFQAAFDHASGDDGASGADTRLQQLHGVRADGAEFPIEVGLWRTPVGASYFCTVMIADMTERRNAEQQIERQRDALRRSERLAAMGSLLAGVAHELNNPLAIAMGRASLLEERCETAALRADARRVREATQRCGRIVRTFLNMARGKGAQRARVNVNDLVLGAADLLHYGYHTHGIELETQLDPALPLVEIDADQVSQIIMNLMINAQQALADGFGPRRVTIGTGVEQQDGQGAGVWLRVADSGPGIAPALRERIFESFFTTKAEGIGTGLGLSVSRSLAQGQGGNLVLEPAGGGGASFL